MASENAGANGGISAVLTTGSVAERNKFDGISGINAVNCVARSNGDGGFSLSGQASHCTAFNNGSVGIGAFAVISSTARLNVSHGIRVSGVAKDNTSHNNGDGGSGAGIYSAANGVRIEGNNCYENDWGIQTAAGINGFIVRNSCRSNSATATNVGASGNFDFDRATNTYGPVEQINGDMSVGQNATSAARASNPWANIQY
jgi:hypothetical protein